MTTLAQHYDCLLLDLDGTVFRGHEPTVGAVDTLAAVEARVLYVTNNASRSPAEVAEHLQSIGFRADAGDVVTSAQSAARLLGEQLPTGAKVLVVGTDALAAEVANVGLVPVHSFDDEPVGVVQGHSPETGWAILAEAALAIRSGALWVAANVDLTLPSERGLLPGNGSMVAALRAASEAMPQVAGKPASTLFSDALGRGDFGSPLVVGDRMDTDIAGGVAARLPSLMVLTGVSTAADVIRAVPAQRPDFLAADLRSLSAPADTLRIAGGSAFDVEVDRDGGAVTATVSAAGGQPADDVSVVRATAHAVWAADVDGAVVTLRAGDDAARQALQRWSLLEHP